MPADQGGHVRVALEEIERLMLAAEESGVRLDGWVHQLAVELRSALPGGEAGDSAAVASRILADPAGSIGAQAHLTQDKLHALKG